MTSVKEKHKSNEGGGWEWDNDKSGGNRGKQTKRSFVQKKVSTKFVRKRVASNQQTAKTFCLKQKKVSTEFARKSGKQTIKKSFA